MTKIKRFLEREFDKQRFLSTWFYPYPEQRMIGFVAAQKEGEVNIELVEKFRKEALEPIKSFIKANYVPRKDYEAIKQKIITEVIDDLTITMDKTFGLHKPDFWLIEWIKKFKKEDYENL